MKGIVMDIRGKKAVVYCNNGQMTETANRNYRVGQRVSVSFRPYVKYIAAAACFFMFCITGIAGRHIYYTPESYIYMDINPSIRLDINHFERVIAVVPLNEDASSLLTARPVKSSDAGECINTIVEACRENNYISEKNTDVEIEIMTNKAKLRSKVGKACDDLKNSGLAVEVSDVSKEDCKRAIELKVSPKRLEALEDYSKTFGGDIDAAEKELSGISNKEIYRKIENGSNESAQPEPSKKPQNEKPQKTQAPAKKMPEQSQKHGTGDNGAPKRDGTEKNPNSSDTAKPGQNAASPGKNEAPKSDNNKKSESKNTEPSKPNKPDKEK